MGRWSMAVNVVVNEVPVTVVVRVSHFDCGCLFDTLVKADEIVDAQKDEHRANGKFHGETEAGRNHQTKQDDTRAYREDGEGVAQTPKRADHRRMAEVALTADDGGDSDDVICIGGMAHAEEESQGENRGQAYAGALQKG